MRSKAAGRSSSSPGSYSRVVMPAVEPETKTRACPCRKRCLPITACTRAVRSTMSQSPRVSTVKASVSTAIGVWGDLTAGLAGHDARHGQAAAQDRGDHAQLPHEPLELLGIEALRAVRKGLLGIVVHLDQQAVGPGRHGGPRHGNDLVAAP